MPELTTAINAFLSRKNFRIGSPAKTYEKTTVSNILKLLEEKYKDTNPDPDLDVDIMEEAVKYTVMGYRSSKSSAIAILKEFLSFLEKKYGFSTSIRFPEIDASNTFERQMYLAKVLQSREVNIETLSDMLWISDRTITDDLLRLRGISGDPIQICGKPFIISETEMNNGIVKMASTAHPFFLTFNLTQVMTTLKGLKAMCQEPAMKNYALTSAAAIWEQLSSYAKERILYVSEHLIPDDLTWYRDLEDQKIEMFQTERKLSNTEGSGFIMYCMKSGEDFHVEYLMEDGSSVFFTHCKVLPRSYSEQKVEVTSDQGNYTLDLNRILRSSSTEEGLF